MRMKGFDLSEHERETAKFSSMFYAINEWAGALSLIAEAFKENFSVRGSRGLFPHSAVSLFAWLINFSFIVFSFNNEKTNLHFYSWVFSGRASRQKKKIQKGRRFVLENFYSFLIIWGLHNTQRANSERKQNTPTAAAFDGVKFCETRNIRLISTTTLNAINWLIWVDCVGQFIAQRA